MQGSRDLVRKLQCKSNKRTGLERLAKGCAPPAELLEQYIWSFVTCREVTQSASVFMDLWTVVDVLSNHQGPVRKERWNDQRQGTLAKKHRMDIWEWAEGVKCVCHILISPEASTPKSLGLLCKSALACSYHGTSTKDT